MKRLSIAVAALLLLGACSLGLDLYTPPDSRDFVASCARGYDAVACKALNNVSGSLSGELTFVLVNASDADSKAMLARDLASKGIGIEAFLSSPEARKFALANTFVAPTLSTGRLATADGKGHDVQCSQREGTQFCRIDGQIEGFNQLQREPGRSGSIYLMDGYLPF
ncbi:hypothetical protein [Deinococcus puniceus]|uniref:Lipoprotein n=1 Tax=Deinococcus puniceus TaxID=1182568 RepID=A0A172TBP2_9DEIO|nr:hypothetical protein [Deinococcus puniceus]ANE44401.1 hypothetical protein SU48_12235 [Deinococcus puniceus]